MIKGNKQWYQIPDVLTKPILVTEVTIEGPVNITATASGVTTNLLVITLTGTE